MTAKDITHHIEKYYENMAEFTVPNIYFFSNGYYETDVLVYQKNGYILDFEIKISVQDFKADFKKTTKHEILSTGARTYEYDTTRLIEGIRVPFKAGETIPCESPNKFYYAVPENLIKVEDIPSYAGLIYVTEFGAIKKIKEAPFLHKTKIDCYERLCKKFYYGYKELKAYQQMNGIDILKRQISRLEKEKEQQRQDMITLHNRVNDLNRELKGLERL